MKEIKDPNKWRGILCLWNERLNRVKMSILHNLISKSNKIPAKPQQDFFVDIDKAIFKLTWKFKGYRIAKITFTENNVGRISMLDFRTL